MLSIIRSLANLKILKLDHYILPTCTRENYIVHAKQAERKQCIDFDVKKISLKFKLIMKT